MGKAINPEHTYLQRFRVRVRAGGCIEHLSGNEPRGDLFWASKALELDTPPGDYDVASRKYLRAAIKRLKEKRHRESVIVPGPIKFTFDYTTD